MKRKINQTQVLVVSVLVTLTLFILLAFYFTTLQTQIQFVQQERQTRQVHLLDGRTTEEIRSDVERISSDLAKLEIFLNQQDQLAFITELERLAARHQLTQQLKLDVNNKKTAVWGGQIIPTTIIVRGDYINGLRYIQDLEQLDYQVNVTAIRINNLSTRTENKGVEIHMTAETFSSEL